MHVGLIKKKLICHHYFRIWKRVDWGKLMLTAINHLDPDAYYYPITYEFTDGSRAQVGCYYINDHTRLKVYTYEYGQVIKN